MKHFGKCPKIVPGFLFSGVACGIKTVAGKRDLALIVSTTQTTQAAGVFTKNAFAAAPVAVCKQALRTSKGRTRAIVINSGNANAGVGAIGLRDARAMQWQAAAECGLPATQVLVSSTGKIGMPLPMPRVEAGILNAVKTLKPSGFKAAAEAITTTDRSIKVGYLTGSIQGRPYTLAAMAKGAGMISPNMATMLAYACTDLAISQAFLQKALRIATNQSFNAISVDGDMSTNDTAIVLSSGAAGNRPISGGKDGERFIAELSELFLYLAREMVLDGEGATKCLEITVAGARSKAQAEAVARHIGNSQLVKCAFFGGDPNWGRILSSIGAAAPTLHPERVTLDLVHTRVFEHNAPASYSEKKLAKELTRLKAIPIHVHLGAGTAQTRFFASDLTPAYVHFNSAYRT